MDLRHDQAELTRDLRNRHERWPGRLRWLGRRCWLGWRWRRHGASVPSRLAADTAHTPTQLRLVGRGHLLRPAERHDARRPVPDRGADRPRRDVHGLPGVDTRLDRPVAIKVMSPHYVTDPAFLGRFEREARLAAGLGHQGVVAVYDYGRDGDLVFLVMELIDGGTLRDLLREQGSLSVAVTMSILEPLLAALGAAHAAGLVHRDVKPEK